MTINVPGSPGVGEDTDAPLSQALTTISELITRIDNKVGCSTLRPGYATFRGNFLQTSFVLPHRNVSNVQALINGARTDGFTAATATGVVTFSVIPPGVRPDEPDNVVISYDYTPWSESEVIDAINASVGELWGKFYWEGVNDTVASTGDPEYEVQDASGYYISPLSRVTRVDWSDESGPTAEWVRIDDWHLRAETGRLIVVLERPVSLGLYLRFSFQCPGGIITSSSDTLESTVGLPTAAMDPLVTLACAQLLESGLGRVFDPLIRGGEPSQNRIKSYEVIQDIQAMRNAAYIKAQRVAMQPFSARIVT